MMNKEIVNRIEAEIGTLLDELKNLDPTTEEYKGIVATINRLYETVNKEKEIGIKQDTILLDADKNVEDRNVRLKENKSVTLLNGLKTGVELAAVVVPVVFYGVWMQKGFEFEKEGTITSNTFKGLIGKFKTNR